MSRKGLFPTGLPFDWILPGLLLIVSRVDFIVFVFFLEAVGVRGYCCMALVPSDRKYVGAVLRGLRWVKSALSRLVAPTQKNKTLRM